MSKVYYPEEGLTELTQPDTNESARAMGNAIAECSFDIPSGFRYTDYLCNLRNVLDGYNIKLKEISEDIKKADSDFRGVSDRAKTMIDAIEAVKITKREQLVK